MGESKINKIILFFFIFLILISASVVIFWQKKINKMSEEEKNYLTQPTPSPTTFPLKTVGETEITLKKVDDLTFEIIASSNNHNIVGFDFIVENDKLDQLNNIIASTLLPSFSLYQSKKNNFLILTGTKKLNFNQSTILNQTPIVSLKTRQPIKLNLKTIWGKYTSKLIDDQSNVLKPKIVLK